MRWTVINVVVVLFAVGCGMETESVGSVSEAATVATECHVTAIGTLPAGDSFDGNADTADSITGGTWAHQTPERTVTVCDDDCARHPGWCRGRGHFDHGAGHGFGHSRRHRHGTDCTTTTERDVFVGDVATMNCTLNLTDIGHVEGTGTWNGAPGYTFEADVQDSTVTGDSYAITIWDSMGTIVYSTSAVPDSGDIVITGF